MPSLATWLPGPPQPQLHDRELHVWRIDLNSDCEQTEHNLNLLSRDERDRADRFLVKQPRNRLIRSRAAMRNILGRYLNVSPFTIVFSANSHGKLYLDHHPVRFNLSHSGSYALLAVTKHHEVGIDIEQMDGRRAGADIARRFFSAAEQNDLFASPEAERIAAFFRIWSRKEAVIKALGEGLHCPLDSFDVSADAGSACLVAFRREEVDTADWRMIDIDAAPEYAAAAAVIGPCETVSGFQL